MRSVFTMLFTIRRVVIALVALLMLFLGGIAAISQPADTRKDELFENIPDASSVVLMISSGIAPPINLTVEQFSKVACRYQIVRSDFESSYANLMEILQQSIVSAEKGVKIPGSFEPHFGMIFKNKDVDLRRFYFGDSPGKYDVHGYSGEYRITGSGAMPGRLRALPTRKDVVFESGSPRCPRW